MPNVTTITITSGVPTAGSGTVSTLDNLIGVAGTASAQVLSVQGIAGMTAVKVDGSGVTQPVSAAALPLPSGAATAAKQPALGTAGSASTDVITVQGIASGTTIPVTATLSPALTRGAGNSDSSTVRTVLATDSAGIIATGTIGNSNLSATILSVDVPANATSIAKLEDAASADGDKGIAAMAIRQATPANTSGTDGDYEMLRMSGGYLWVHDNKGLANLAFSAAFSTLTRPANTTAYSAGDSISDNATAGSVTALSATLADVNDDPIFLSEILIKSTDTGLAGKRVRAYLFNSDPTASSGVGGGDNAAYSQKVAGYIGSFSGVLESGFSDGTVGRLVPSYADGAAAGTPHAPAGGFVVTKPTSGAKTLFVQFQAVDGFTPSANSTTIIATARGWQGRAA